MHLLIVRHGETEQNMQDIIQGHTHGTLSEKGKRQVQRLARRLKKEKINAIFSSDLQRVKDTTTAIAQFHSIPIQYSRRLREKCYGVLEGKPSEEYFQALRASGVSRVTFRPSEGENYIDLQQRLRVFLKRIYPKYKNKTVLLSTHGGCIKVLLGLLRSIPLEKAIRIRTPNAGMRILELSNGRKPIFPM